MLKRILIICTIICSSQLGFSQGMEFAQLTLDEALSKAGKENKLVFVDAYTSWCGPCKKMNKSVFPSTDVGNYFNANFINLKIDMEKGEGPSVAKRYGVRSYPTYLFLDESGSLIHRSGGYRPPAQFVKVGQEAMSPEKQLALLKKKYNAEGGKDDLRIMYRYAMMALQAGDPEGPKVALDYKNKVTDHSDRGYQELMMAYGQNANSEFFNDIISNRDDFENVQGADFVSNYVKGALLSELMGMLNSTSPKEASKFTSRYANADEAKALDQVYRIYFNQLNKNEGEVKNAANELIKLKSIGTIESDLLQTLGQYYLAKKESMAELKNAIIWVNKSIELDPDPKKYATLSALYDKIGDSGKAQQYEQKAKAMLSING